MQKIIIDDTEFITALEALQYKIDAQRALLNFMIQSEQSINNDNFQSYEAKYYQTFKEYSDKKKELEIKYVIPIVQDKAVNWSVDFSTKELTIYD